MKNKAVSGIMLTLLLIGMFGLALNITPARAEPRTWTVDDDGPADFSKIKDAIMSPEVTDGDTILVRSGTYHEHDINVYKSLSLIGEDKATTIIDGDGFGPVVRIARFPPKPVNITGFTIQNGSQDWFYELGSGLLLYNAESCNISDLIVSNSGYGIASYRGRHNIISGNTISDTEIGILLYRANNNTVVHNVVTNSSWGGPYWGGGIYLDHSYDNTVAGNTISNTTEVGIWLNSYNNVVEDNTISDAELACMLEEHSHHNILLGNVISKSVVGVYLAQSSYNNTIMSNTISNLTSDGAGINPWGPNNRIIGNTITNIGYVGIQLNSISSDGGYGVPNACTNNVVSGNVISNSTFGINLILAAFSNTIAGNNVSNNGLSIFISDHSDNNTVINNLVSNNDYGILLFSSNDTKVYHNNFIDNTQQVLLSDSFNTAWDDSYPSGGNYWSDYADVDLFNGPNQNVLGMDGIWDHSYIIDARNRDRYPLVKPWPTIPATLDVDPDTLNLRSEGKWITAYIQLPERYNPEDIDSTTILLNDTIQPVLDPKYDFVTNSSEYLVDHNEDGILERMVKFDRAIVQAFIYNQGITYGEVSLTITGELFDGTPFEGTDVIFVNHAGDVNNDGIINILDVGVISAHWYPGPPTGTLGYDSICDFNRDEAVNILDVGILSINWGQTVP